MTGSAGAWGLPLKKQAHTRPSHLPRPPLPEGPQGDLLSSAPRSAICALFPFLLFAEASP